MSVWVAFTVSLQDLLSLFLTGELATEEFDALCFDFGIELDEDVSVLSIPIEST
jgi:hypothetical protein